MPKGYTAGGGKARMVKNHRDAFLSFRKRGTARIIFSRMMALVYAGIAYSVKAHCSPGDSMIGKRVASCFFRLEGVFIVKKFTYLAEFAFKFLPQNACRRVATRSLYITQAFHACTDRERAQNQRGRGRRAKGAVRGVDLIWIYAFTA